MPLFAKKENILGVDLGTSSLKVVELTEENGVPTLETYGFAEERIDLVKSDADETKHRVVSVLKNVMKKAESKATKVVLALPNYSVFSSIISLPSMSKKELMSAVRWEARKFVPMPIEDMNLDWKVLTDYDLPKAEEVSVQPKSVSPAATGSDRQTMTFADEGTTDHAKTISVLLTAAPQSLVKRYVEVFQMAQLQLVSVETESFALTRSLIGRDMSAVMIVDIGALNTNIMIIVNNVPVLNRSIDVGGESITQRIAQSLNIERDRAEQFKRDFGMSGGTNDDVPKTIEFVIGTIVNEIKYVINLYQSQMLGRSSGKEIEKVILTGGSAFLPKLTEYLERILQTKVIIGDPWARVAHPVDLKPVLDEVGPRLAVAVGLALRELV